MASELWRNSYGRGAVFDEIVFRNGRNSMESLIPTKLVFFIGGFGPGWEVRWEEGKLSYRCGFFGEGTEIGHERIPTEAEWQEFWRGVETAKVWEWRKKYSQPVLDGTSWSLEIVYNGKRLRSRGDNGYPGSDDSNYDEHGPFGILLKAIIKLGHVPKDYWS